MKKKYFLWAFAQEIYAALGFAFIATVALSLASGFTQSISIFLLFPLLEAAQVVPTEHSLEWVGDTYQRLLHVFGLRPALTTALGVFITVVLLRGGFNRWYLVWENKVVLALGNRLRKQLYAAIINADWLYFCRQKPAHFIQVLTADIGRIIQGVFELLRLISQLVLMVAYIVTALLIDWRITVCVSVSGLLVLLLQRRFSGRAYALGLYQCELDKEMFQWINESLNNLKLIKTSAKEAQCAAWFGSIVASAERWYVESNRHYADLELYFQGGSSVILAGFIYLSVVWFGLPGASLLVLLFVFSKLMPLVSSLWGLFNRLKHMQAAHENYWRLFNECQQSRSVLAAGKGRPLVLEDGIYLHGVRFNYRPGELPDVFSGLSLRIPANQITAIVGVSGVGKTTLCDLVTGLFRPLAGEVKVDAVRLDDSTIAQWHRQTIYLTQEALLFNDTIRNNMCWYRPGASDAECLQALRAAELHAWLANLPEGLDTLVGERGIRLSGGEKQRLALARAFLAQPTLLVLDEASSALDVLNEQKVSAAVRELRDKGTVILIAHRLSSVRLADHIIVLDRGEAVQQGSWGDLAGQRQGRFCELLAQSQLQ